MNIGEIKKEVNKLLFEEITVSNNIYHLSGNKDKVYKGKVIASMELAQKINTLFKRLETGGDSSYIP